jgi:hypothetical protein
MLICSRAQICARSSPPQSSASSAATISARPDARDLSNLCSPVAAFIIQFGKRRKNDERNPQIVQKLGI